MRGIRRIRNAFIIIIQTGKAALPPNAEANISFSVTCFPPSGSRQLAFLWLPTENTHNTIVHCYCSLPKPVKNGLVDFFRGTTFPAICRHDSELWEQVLAPVELAHTAFVCLVGFRYVWSPMSTLPIPIKLHHLTFCHEWSALSSCFADHFPMSSEFYRSDMECLLDCV